MHVKDRAAEEEDEEEDGETPDTESKTRTHTFLCGKMLDEDNHGIFEMIHFNPFLIMIGLRKERIFLVEHLYFIVESLDFHFAWKSF